MNTITDHTAQHAAETAVGHYARDFDATFQHYVNDHGVAVRRLILTGPEEVDPTAKQAAA